MSTPHVLAVLHSPNVHYNLPEIAQSNAYDSYKPADHMGPFPCRAPRQWARSDPKDPDSDEGERVFYDPKHNSVE